VNPVTSRTAEAATDDFWLTKQGVHARLAALSHDLVWRIYNSAYHIDASKAGFKDFTWITQPGLTKAGPCPDCLGFDGHRYRRGQFMPGMTRHVNCVCFWRAETPRKTSP
jgi:hypothetical protein